jgi:hypothetical protein
VTRFGIAAVGFLFIVSSASRAQETPPATEVPLGKGAYIQGAPVQLSAEEAARQLANPNTPLATLTLKSQWTSWEGSLPGADGRDSQTFLFQPSFPFPINETDLIFLRPAFPYLVDQPVVDASGSVRAASGFGDMGMDLAYGRTTKSGLIMAGGLVAGIPIGAERLSSDTWTLGPEFFIGRITKKTVVGIYPNHQWDVSGPRQVSLTTIQPIATYLPGGGWAIGSAGSMTYNWETEQWTIPIQVQVSKTVILGKLPLKLALEGNYYVEKADALGPGWMIGFNIAPVVPNVVAEWLGGK